MRMESVGHTQARLIYHRYRLDSVSVEDFEANVARGTLVSEEDPWIVPLVLENLGAGVCRRGTRQTSPPNPPPRGLRCDREAGTRYSAAVAF